MGYGSHKFDKGKLTFAINDSFRNIEWARSFGELISLSKKENPTWDKIEINRVVFDLSNCTWIDPIPTLSILIACKSFRVNGITTNLILPDYRSRSLRKKRVLLFLTNENFVVDEGKKIVQGRIVLNRKTNFDSIKSGNLSVNGNDIKQIDAFLEKLYLTAIKPTFEQSSFVPFTVINTNEIGQAQDSSFDSYVSNIIPPTLLNRLQDKNLSPLLYRAKFILDETLHNIYKHAYGENDKKFAGFFIRIRRGLLEENLTDDQQKSLKRALNKEVEYTPHFKKIYALEKGLYLEVFVLDHGIGIQGSSEKRHQKKRPLRDLIIDIFIKGKRRKGDKNKDRTEFGGLHSIHNLLSINRDSIWLKSMKDIAGKDVPFEEAGIDKSTTDVQRNDGIHRKNLKRDQSYEKNNRVTDGVAWAFRISNIESIKPDTINFFSYAPQDYKDHPFWKSLCSNPNFDDSRYLHYPIIDNREFASDNSKLSVLTPKNSKYTLFFPEEILSKYGVHRSIFAYFKKNGDLYTEGKLEYNTLFIVDIPEFNTHSYISALNKATFYRKETSNSKKWALHYSRIILLTKNLRFCVLNRKITNTYITYESSFDESEKYSGSINSIKGSFNPELYSSDLFHWIRFYESLFFWSSILSLNKYGGYFLPEEIKWNDEVGTIEGYLNFAQVLSNNRIRDLIRTSFIRLLGIKKGKPKFIYIDILIKNLAHQLNQYSEASENSDEEIYSIIIGSVHVTGEHAEAINIPETSLSPNEENDPHVRILSHISTLKENYQPSLFGWPTKKWINESLKKSTSTLTPVQDSNLSRVGKTHIVAKHGWKYFNIPRYTHSGIPFYERSPKESYLDIQSQLSRILKVGNFNYQTSSDLYKIDVERAVTLDFWTQGLLSRYLLEEFLFALYPGSFSDEEFENLIDYYTNKQLINDYEDESIKKFKSIERSGFYKNVFAIVYPVHQKTSYIISQIKSKLDTFHLHERIFPITPLIEDLFGSSMFISPLIFDQLEKLVLERKNAGYEKSDILFFDDVKISGRTELEIKSALKSIGVNRIKSLFILDRSRLPMSIPNKNKLRAYWRFDIPRLSQKGLNPIDTTVEKLLATLSSSNSGLLTERILKIKSVWRSRSLFKDHDIVGLSPIPLNIKKNRRSKKFGIELDPEKNYPQIGGPDNEIDILTSTGLSIWLSEMQSATGRYDIIELVLTDKDYGLNIEGKIEILCVHLLLYRNSLPVKVKEKLLFRLYHLFRERTSTDSYSALALIVLSYFESFNYKRIITNLKKNELKAGANEDIILFSIFSYKSAQEEWGENLDFELLFNKIQFPTANVIALFFRRVFSQSSTNRPSVHFNPFGKFLYYYNPNSRQKRLPKNPDYFLHLTDLQRGLHTIEIVLDKLSKGQSHSYINYFNYIHRKHWGSNYWDDVLFSSIDEWMKADTNKFIVLAQTKINVLKKTIEVTREKPTISNHKIVYTILQELISTSEMIVSRFSFPIYHTKGIKISLISLIKDIHKSLTNKREIEAILLKISDPEKNTTVELPEIGIAETNSIPKHWDHKKIYIPFNFGVEELIKNLLSNSIYGTTKIKNPFIGSPDNYEILGFKNESPINSLEANLWVNTFYSDNYLEIYFSNAIESSEDNIIEKIESSDFTTFKRASLLLEEIKKIETDLETPTYFHNSKIVTLKLKFKLLNYG